MKVLTSAQMRALDRKAIEDLGIIGPVLMENAGLEIVRAITERFPDIAAEKVVIVAGKGNNGGDGFVVARHLFNRGCRPEVILLARQDDVKGDAGLNLSMIDRMGISIREAQTQELWEERASLLKEATLLVDAIFGTGLTKPARGFYARVIEEMNQASAFKVAVDIPSGLSSDSFEVIGPCLRADLTVTMAAPKIAHVFPPAEECVGELAVADISMPPFVFEDDSLKLEMVEQPRIVPHFRNRSRDSHKGTFGHALIIAGSVGKTGAAGLAGKAALKMGAGLVTVGTPRSCLSVVARSMLELMTEPLPETPDGTLDVRAVERILELLQGKDALMLGPGISTHASTAELVLQLLPRVDVPIVIDADGLNILARKPEVLKSIGGPLVLTPHPGEFARLLGISARQVVAEKLELTTRFAQEHGVYLVLKGYRTLTAAPDGRIFINPTGNPGLATGGSGDVLSGMLVSMIIQEDDILEAILAAVFIHGLSGDLATRRFGEKPLVAGNIITYLPAAIKTLNAM